MDYLETKLFAVGHVKSNVKDASIPLKKNDLEFDQQVHSQQVSKTPISEIIVDEEFEDCLDGIEEFSHIIVTFLTDIPEDARKTIKRIHPAGIKEAPLKGIFSSRSPVRPNPLAISIVKLIKREKNILEVEDLDAIDKTAILDIKPFLGKWDAPKDSITAPWVFELEKLHQKMTDKQ